MVEQIYRQLKVPKTLEQLHEVMEELGLKWNMAQLELFLSLDKKVIRNETLYSVQEDNSDEQIILETIDRVIGTKPMIPIKKIMEQIPHGIIVSVESILKVALNSGKYSSPNREVLKRIN